MSSAAKKGEKGKNSHPTPSASKETSSQASTKTTVKSGDKNAEGSKNLDQLVPKLQPTAEQLRIAQMISDNKRDDPELPQKVEQLVELTNCSPDAAVIALHDANNDLDQAIAALLDGETEGDWEVSGKKRKPKGQSQQLGAPLGASEETSGGGGTNGGGSGRGRDWNRDRDRSRSNRGGPPRLRGRGRGRENKENVDDGEGEVGSRGRGSRGGSRMSNGPGRERSGGRGGGRGGRGYRRTPHHQTADTWEDGAENNTMKVEPWGVDFPSAEDWDNEEYIGSLVETKVFTPSQSATVSAAPVSEAAPLTNGSTVPTINNSMEGSAQVLYSTVAVGNTAQQGLDLNALLQKSAAASAAGSTSAQQQYLHYSQQAADALKAAMGVVTTTTAQPVLPSVIQQQQQPPQQPPPQQQQQHHHHHQQQQQQQQPPQPPQQQVAKPASKPQRVKMPPTSKIPSSAVEMPDDPLISGLDVKFGTLDFGIESTGFDMSCSDLTSTGTIPTAGSSSQSEQQTTHGLMQKIDQYNSTAAPQPPAASALPKPDTTLGGFGSSVPSAVSSMVTATSQVKATTTPAFPYGGAYGTPGVSNASSQPSSTGTGQPAGAYPSSQTVSGGVYSSSTSVSGVYQTPSSQTNYGTYGQQQSSTYQGYNKLNPASGLTDSSSSAPALRVDLSSVTATATSRPPATTVSATGNTTKPAGTAAGLAPVSSLPPGVPTMLGPGGFIMGQAPGLPYYAAAAAAGIQQHPVYSLEDVQFRYPHLAAAGYYDMGYQSPTGLSTGREGTLASLTYAGADAKFPRNDNNSPVPTSLSQNPAQSHGGAFINPAAAAAATPLPPAYAYYYSGGVMPAGYQFGAPAALYPVSAATSGHAGSGATAQYGKGGPLGGGGGAAGAQSSQTAGGSAGGGPSTGTASYASYGSTYDDFSKSVYGSVGVGSGAGQAAKIGGVGGTAGPTGVGSGGAADLGVGPTAYGKTHSQLGKINSYDKAGGFHTGTPPPYGLAGSATGAPLGVGVSVGVGGPSPYATQHMFIPALTPHQSHHSPLMHPQLHQDTASGPGQRSQGGGQPNKPGSKPSYGSYWASN